MVVGDDVFTWGIPGLDRLFGSTLTPGTTVVVAGNHGAGKTTFATTMCYANARRGYPCLYITLQEPREKFVRALSVVLLVFLAFILSGGFLSISETLYRGLPPYAMFIRGSAVQSLVETFIFFVTNLMAVGALYWSWKSARGPRPDLTSCAAGLLVAISALLIEVYVIFHLKLGFI